MPHLSYREFAPYKVVRCHFFDSFGRALYPYCAEGDSCRFLHPHDRGFPGLEPKQPLRSERSPSFSSPALSRKRVRSPFQSPRPSISPDRRREHRGRSASPGMAIRQNYGARRHSPTPRYIDGHHNVSPPYRRERSPRLTYGNRRSYPGTTISSSNATPLRSPRSARPRFSTDTSRGCSSPELQTPSDDVNERVPHNGFHRDTEVAKANHPESPYVGRGDLSTESGRQWEAMLSSSLSSPPKAKPLLERVSPAVVKTVDPYVPVSPKGPLASDGSSNIMKLINQLTKVHLRLLDNRKTYEDESLKLQAFESLAAKFDITTLSAAVATAKPSTSNSASTFGPFGSAFTTTASSTGAFGAARPTEEHDRSKKAIPTGPANRLQGRSSSFPLSNPHSIGQGGSDNRAMSGHPFDNSVLGGAFSVAQAQPDKVALSNNLEHNPSVSVGTGQIGEEAGHKVAHQALLETLNGIKERQSKLGTRVRDDFEEMALVLETIWTGTFNTRTARTMENPAPRNTNTKAVGNSDDALSRSKPFAPASAAVVATSAASSNLPQALHVASKPVPMATDANGKVAKKMRRVLFDDELGASEQKKEVLRRLEEKIVGMERKLAKLALVEKENVKMKAELKSQKDALEAIKESVDGQAKVIAQLAESQSNPSHANMETEEVSQDAENSSSH